MKRTTKIIFILTLVVIGRMMFDLSGCTNDDQIIEPVAPEEEEINSATDLVALKVTTPPTIDGVVDAFWANNPVLEFSTAVPEVTGDVFRGYTGNIIPSVKLRSAYDNEFIYFLAEWDDPTESMARNPWYFNPTTKKWLQEKGTFDFDAATNGGSTRKPFYEDKMSMLWNINNSVKDWNTATCYKSCHTGLPAADGSSRHFTNFNTEKIDMWHWKSVRGGVNAGYQIHDQYQDNTYPNGRKSDVGGTDVYTNNTQKLNNGVEDVNVPKYVVPGATNKYWILDSEITAGTAKLVTAVDASGVLTLAGGATLDPNTDTGYQRAGANTAPNAIAGLTLKDAGYGTTQGEITCKAVWANSKWTMEYKRKLTTGDSYDIDFSSLNDQYFGFAIFENAQIAHSIKPNLLLKFKK
jgi:hypothetical protein